MRFPEFSGEWVEKRFDDIYSFKNTNSYSREKLNYENGKVKNIHYGDIHTKFDSLFHIDKEEVPFVNQDIDASKINEDCYLRNGDLVIADASEDYNDIGKTIEIHNLNGEKVVAGLHTFLARKESEDMANGFASFLMKTHTVRLQIMKIAQGIKVLGISKNRLDKIPLVIPATNEQTKIADFLTSIDERIATQNKIIGDYKLLKKGMMQKIFNKELRFKDENGDAFPEWKENKIGRICNLKRGASPRPITSSKWFDDNSKIGWVRISDVSKSNKYLNETQQYLSHDGVKKSRLVEKGNMIMSICATIGKPIYTNFRTCIHDGFVVFESLEVEKEYFYYYLEKIQCRWYRYGQPGTQVNLNTDIVSNEEIPIPCKTEQLKIASILSAIDKKIELEINHLEKLKAEKQYLLQNLFI